MSTRRRGAASVGKNADAMKAPPASMPRTGNTTPSGRVDSLPSSSGTYRKVTPQVSIQSCAAPVMFATTVS